MVTHKLKRAIVDSPIFRMIRALTMGRRSNRRHWVEVPASPYLVVDRARQPAHTHVPHN